MNARRREEYSPPSWVDDNVEDLAGATQAESDAGLGRFNAVVQSVHALWPTALDSVFHEGGAASIVHDKDNWHVVYVGLDDVRAANTTDERDTILGFGVGAVVFQQPRIVGDYTTLGGGYQWDWEFATPLPFANTPGTVVLSPGWSDDTLFEYLLRYIEWWDALAAAKAWLEDNA